MPRPHRILVIAILLLGCATAQPAQPAPPPKPEAEHHGHDGHGGGMVHDFSGAERWAKIFDDPARDAWQRPADVVALLELKPGMTVADLGAGTGYFEPHLARAVGPTGRVLALDTEPDMVRYLAERAAREKLANVEARKVAPDDPGLPAAAVDRVVIVDTWHHLPDRPAYARKLAAGLAPGGAVVVVDFTLESKMGPPVHARIPPAQVAAELAAAGLDARVVDEPLPEQYVVVARRR
jgi:predicted methyltransferase